ncbi:MAG: lasso peptide biosynthesis B2 protein [Pyrinomonadaceae bacterium]
MINVSTRINIASGVYCSPASKDGCVVLNIEQGTVLCLNESGALMMSKLAESGTGLTRNEFVEALLPEFEGVDGSRIEIAVDNLLAQLDQKKALQQRETGPNNRTGQVRARLLERLAAVTRMSVVPILFLDAYKFAALALLLIMDSILKLGGFSSFHRAVSEWELAAKKSPCTDIARACDAVNRACTWHPRRALCLQRAAVMVCLLRSLGVPANMVIGVHKMPFYGHAWAEVEGRVINDHENAKKFFQVLGRC